MENIKVIDLFAGPGGLGEGFSAFKDQGNHPFKIAISIEKESSAHRTLSLRSFYRQFGQDTPEEYYQFLRGELGKAPEEELYKIKCFQKEVAKAQREARQLTLGEDNALITAAIDEAVGRDDCILIGGPPCQAYSLAGRSRNQGITSYKAEDDNRNFLYLEYLKVIARYQPMLFVMENVKGMLSAKINGKSIFDDIRIDLHDPCKATGTKPGKGRKKHDYRIVSLVCPAPAQNMFSNPVEDTDPRDYIIKSENFGIPQRRHRVILLGIRDDIAPKWNNDFLLTRHNQHVTTSEVIGDLPKIRSGLSKGINTDQGWLDALQHVKDSLNSTLRNSNLDALSEHLNNTIIHQTGFNDGQGANMGLQKSARLKVRSNKTLQDWLADSRLDKFVVNHESRGHIETDLRRYLFCSIWAQAAFKEQWDNPFPKSRDYPEALKPNHKNFDSGKFIDRFRVQLEHAPATTITSHISKDGHYYIHPDPLQCRSFTVREAARIQTFPDNYFFVGNRTQQYVQVGNAVPPYLANQVAFVVQNLLT